MKTYCTRNGGDCSTCALSSYGRDCRNEPVTAGPVDDKPRELRLAEIPASTLRAIAETMIEQRGEYRCTVEGRRTVIRR